MSISLLFYSNFCQNCKQIVRQINKSSVSSNMRYVCIDSKEVREKLPPYIKSVPALVVGETNQIYVGNQILGWLEMQPIIKRKAMTNSGHLNTVNQQTNQLSQINQNVPKHIPTNVPANNKPTDDGPNAWHNNEMNAFSDMYSFLDIDTSAEGNGGMSMVHNFETISNGKMIPNNMGAPGRAPSNPSMPLQYGNPVTNPVINHGIGSVQMSQKSDELNKQMEEMMNRRELDVPNVPARV